MREELDQIHPQEPAEGSEEDVEAPGVEHARDDLGEPEEDPEEPAESGEDQVDAPGADRPGSGG